MRTNSPAAHQDAPRSLVNHETTSSAIAATGINTPPTIPWIGNPISPAKFPRVRLSVSPLSTTPPPSTKCIIPPNPRAIAAAWTTTNPAISQAIPL